MKGYVVRGTWQGGPDVYAYWWSAIGGVHWTVHRHAVPKDATLLFATLGEAIAALLKSSHLSDVRVFAVADDGTETALPSYEDAIGQRNAFRDHLAIADKRADAAVAERDALLIPLDRVDCDGKSLPGELREDIGKALDVARKAGWRSNDADRAEYACPDCGKDARVGHEGME